MDFLLAVANTQDNPGTPLHQAAGYDVLETNIATATARQFGLVKQSRTGRVTLTQDGVDWAFSQLRLDRVASLHVLRHTARGGLIMQWKVFGPAVTPELVRLIQLAEEENRPHPVLDSGKSGNPRIRAYLGEEAFRAASLFSAACAINPEQSAVLHRAADVLPSDFFTVLVAICGMRMGFETTERELGWPTRSAKLVLAMALSELTRRGVV